MLSGTKILHCNAFSKIYHSKIELCNLISKLVIVGFVKILYIYVYTACIYNNCDCNYILFTKLPWPGDSEGTFRSSSQAATCPPVYHTRRRLHTVPLIAERQAGKL